MPDPSVCPDPSTLPVSTGIPAADAALGVLGALLAVATAFGLIPNKWPWLGALGAFGKRFGARITGGPQ